MSPSSDGVRAGASTFLAGPRVALRPLEAEDAPHLGRWMNDDVTTYFMFTGQRPLTRAQVAEELARLVGSPANSVFLVVERKSGQPIGFAGLYDINASARKAEFRILLGEAAYRGRGYGTEVTELLTFYGFDRLNLNRIWLGVTDDNLGARRAYEKAGYRYEGTLRQDLYRNSRYYDSVRMSVLRDEYYNERYKADAARFASRAAEGVQA